MLNLHMQAHGPKGGVGGYIGESRRRHPVDCGLYVPTFALREFLEPDDLGQNHISSAQRDFDEE
jgi:hypothetical protein